MFRAKLLDARCQMPDGATDNSTVQEDAVRFALVRGVFGVRWPCRRFVRRKPCFRLSEMKRSAGSVTGREHGSRLTRAGKGSECRVRAQAWPEHAKVRLWNPEEPRKIVLGTRTRGNCFGFGAWRRVGKRRSILCDSTGFWSAVAVPPLCQEEAVLPTL
jgi:hypothetical protein